MSEFKQNEITQTMDLLDSDGLLHQAGWARFPYWRYDRSQIKASWLRIKEWDYYYVLSPDLKRGVTLTVSDLGYIGLMAICWLDFENNQYVQVDDLVPLTAGKLGLGADSNEAELSFESKKLSISLSVRSGKRRLSFDAPRLRTADGRVGLEGELDLDQGPNLESVNIATSWAERRTAFYYNRKINCMPARGRVTVGGTPYEFQPERDMGALDWGRGNWTYKNRWFWSSASGLLKGQSFGFNLGYGFSDRSPASENAVIYRDRVHKLADVSFHFDRNNYLAPWQFSSSDGRLTLDFAPCIDRYANTNFLILKSVQHQVFGYFSGRIVLDNGDILQLDRFLGFAEDVLNWW